MLSTPQQLILRVHLSLGTFPKDFIGLDAMQAIERTLQHCPEA